MTQLTRLPAGEEWASDWVSHYKTKTIALLTCLDDRGFRTQQRSH